jgi:lysozyme
MNSVLDDAVAFVQSREGCRLKAYQDIVGVWTIGYGETLGVHEGMEWTAEYAVSRLRLRVARFMAAVQKYCPTLSNRPNSLVAATSLAYNIGVGAFRASSVCRLSNRREWQRAADSFLLWNKAKGRVVAGLDHRRRLERQLFLTP